MATKIISFNKLPNQSYGIDGGGLVSTTSVLLTGKSLTVDGHGSMAPTTAIPIGMGANRMIGMEKTVVTCTQIQVDGMIWTVTPTIGTELVSFTCVKNSKSANKIA